LNAKLSESKNIVTTLFREGQGNFEFEILIVGQNGMARDIRKSQSQGCR